MELHRPGCDSCCPNRASSSACSGDGESGVLRRRPGGDGWGERAARRNFLIRLLCGGLQGFVPGLVLQRCGAGLQDLVQLHPGADRGLPALQIMEYVEVILPVRDAGEWITEEIMEVFSSG